jgi:formylglycine-generating enzyme required for sulfatase activity
MMKSNRFVLISGLVLVLAASIYLGINLVPRVLPVPVDQAMLAQRGVSENEAWVPVIRRIEGVEMALVPSGCFEMGSTDPQLQDAVASCDSYYGGIGCQEDLSNEQPAHQVCISEPYWIDRTPVTNRQVRAYPGRSDLRSGYQDPSFPRGAVTWQEAGEICAWRGARLPTEAEWEFAARGPDGLVYPFGDTYEIDKVSLRKISPVPVGEKPEGASWVGALDMSGGISEWVADWYGPYPAGAQTDPPGPGWGEARLARGGNWFAHASFFVRATYREVLSPEHATSTVGFRCARHDLATE